MSGLTKKASEAAISGDDPPFPIYSNRTKARRSILEGRVTTDRALAKRISKLEIRFSAVLNQLASDSCSLNGYLFKLRKVLVPSCPNCGYAKETVTHFINFCPAYKIPGRDLRKELRRSRINHDLDNLYLSLIKNLKAWPASAKFVQATNRFQFISPRPVLKIPEVTPENETEISRHVEVINPPLTKQ